MGWVTLNLRKMEDQVLHNNFQAQLLGISRRRQQIARHKSYQSLLINNDRKQQQADIKVDKENKYKEYQEAYDKYTKLKKAYDTAKNNAEKYKNKITGTQKVMFDENMSPILSDNGTDFKTPETAYVDNGKYLKEDAGGNLDSVQGYWIDESKGEFKEIPEANIQDVNYYQDGDNEPLVILSESQLEELKNQVEAAEDEKTKIYSAYNEAVTDYEEQKKNLNDMFDQELQTLEEEVTTEENIIDLEQSQTETQMEAYTQELQAVKQQISQDMQNTLIQLK